jgi:exopolysaccharide biosynthesis predicted pyruvyltransferase EpsI/GT2 family glycosyltransferase
LADYFKKKGIFMSEVLTNKGLISVIVPVYNVEKYISKCIDSIINQSYKNLEIILVDDGSKDNSGVICDNYALKDKRIKVIHKKNGGLSSARNCGIDAANGDYFGFVDSDDWIDKDMYYSLLDSLIKNESDIAICGYYEYCNNKVRFHSCCVGETIYDNKEAMAKLIQDNTFGNFAVNKLYKKQLFKEIRYPVGMNMEDLGTTYKLFSEAKRISVIESPMYYYFVKREGSILTNISLKTRFDCFELHKLRYNDLVKIYPDQKDILEKYIMNSALYFITDYRKSKNRKNYRNEYRRILAYLRSNYKKIKSNPTFDFRSRIRFGLLCINPSFLNIFESIFRMLKKTYLRKIYSYFHLKFIENKYYKLHKADIIKDKKIIIIGSPEHNNLGDHAIALSQLNFFKSFKDYKLVEITEASFCKSRKLLKKSISSQDIIILSGGGDIGNQYLWIENTRRNAIRSFPENYIYIFPQTAFFTKDKNGEKELSISQKIYGSHKYLTIFAREQVTYEFLKNNFPNNKIELCPDIVLINDKMQPQFTRKGALLCLRSDLEGKLSYKEIAYLRDCCREIYDRTDVTDTVYSENIAISDREKRLEEKFNQFKKYEVVVTDRLHGVIFAAITGTPCIALGNYNHKVLSLCNWLKPLPYVKFVDNIENIRDNLIVLKKQKNNFYDVRLLENHFAGMKKKILENSGYING